jgi:hypothetical protein
MDEVEEQSRDVVAPPETEASHGLSPQEEQPEQEKSWVNQLRRERSEFKRRAEDAERRAEMNETMLRTLSSNQSFQQKQPVEEDFLAEIEKEEYVAGSKVAKGIKKLQAQFESKLQEIDKKYQSRAQDDAINDLRREMPDLDDIVNHETLKMVERINPKLRQTWVGKSDYDIYLNAYPYIKHSGIMDKFQGERSSMQLERKIEQNKKTVPSTQSLDKRPIAQAFSVARLSQSELSDIHKEMEHCASMVGSVPYLSP